MIDVELEVEVKQEIKPPSRWTVVLHNDNYTPMDFVTHVLMMIFHQSLEEAIMTMLQVHETGRANIGSYTKEIAQTKAKEVVDLAEQHGHPLLATPDEI